MQTAAGASVTAPTALTGNANLQRLGFVQRENAKSLTAITGQSPVLSYRRLRLAPPIQSPAKFFTLFDQSVVVAIPQAHDVLDKFRLRDAQPASAPWRCVLIFDYVNEGGTCLGPDLEAQFGRRLCGVRIRRRDFGGGILSSGV